MKANNLTPQIDQLFNIKTLYTAHTLNSCLALVLSLYPLLFDFSPEYWLIPLLGILCFTLVLTMQQEVGKWHWMNFTKFGQSTPTSDSIEDAIEDTIAPIMVTQFGKSNPENRIQVA